MANQFSGNVFEKSLEEDKQGEVFLGNTIGINTKKMYLESYGCAMNFSDSEIVASIMMENGYSATSDVYQADVIFINTCSIRENAEQKVRGRLGLFREIKRSKPELVVGVLGCMAERLKAKLLDQEKLVDLVIGPDAYKDLPNLLEKVEGGQKAVNVLLSREETYADITPVRLGGNGILAFVTIMRGCDNMCSFCVVPFTRGRERSRDMHSIIEEVIDLANKGYKDITLLGQNVDSYHWESEDKATKVNFANLLEMVALAAPKLRIRFSTSHPKDITDEVLHTIAKYDNIAKCVHLPVQAGSSSMLKRMNRTYSRDWYINRVDAIRRILPGCAITTDIIVGFCGETEEEHKETMSMMEYVKYDFAFMFKYSERPGTLAAKKYTDDVPEEVKSARLTEIIDFQHTHCAMRNKNEVGNTLELIIESDSKKSDKQFAGRTSTNKIVILDKKEGYSKGDLVNVLVTHATQATLFGDII